MTMHGRFEEEEEEEEDEEDKQNDITPHRWYPGYSYINLNDDCIRSITRLRPEILRDSEAA